jgi:pyruvate dehydrogenase E2 component (dihydrolipoamide acetyltransferase)
MPKLEMAQETATVVEWLKQEGEHVEKGEPLLVVETDKVTVEIESPASGILAGVLVEPQQVVPVTEVIAHVLQPGEELPQEQEAPAAALAASPRPAVEAAPEKVRATPAARRIARERRVDLRAVTGSGPGGRIKVADVEAFAPAPAAEVIPLRGMRRTIAERMTASYQTAPHITFTVRVNMSGFEEARARLNAKAEATEQPRVSATALIVKAVAWALKRHPWLNSTLRDEEIHLLPEINVGVAVALEEGLIVPVVRQADHKSVAEIATEVNDLTTRARQGRLTPADVADGTFTVSNLGPFGIEQFTAIINLSQAAILAVGATQSEPVVDEEGQVAVRPVMRMTLSADHRIIDGAVAARFLTDLREALEAPTLLLY